MQTSRGFLNNIVAQSLPTRFRCVYWEMIATPIFCTEKECYDWAVQVFQATIVAQYSRPVANPDLYNPKPRKSEQNPLHMRV